MTRGARREVGYEALIAAARSVSAERRTGFVDWRGVRGPKYAPPVDARIDPTTGESLCIECGRSLHGRSDRARFCNHDCRSRYHAARQHAAARREPIETRVHLGVAAAATVECAPRYGMWAGHPRKDICRIHGGPLRRRGGQWVHG